MRRLAVLALSALIAVGLAGTGEPLVPLAAIPNDTYYPSAWHLPRIEAPAAWDMARASTRVAICDTGVDGTHPDLQPILIPELGWNVNGSKDWSPIATHGMITAGVFAATDNGIGVSGVAWAIAPILIPIRVSNSSSGAVYPSDAALCIRYAADHAARVVGIPSALASYAVVQDAADYAAARGCLTFLASGNGGERVNIQDYPSLIVVGATEGDDSRAWYSNTGPHVDIVAPGSGIWTTTFYGYDPQSGTSIAMPVAMGVASLIFSVQPLLNAEQARSILYQSADDIGPPGRDDEYGWGRVNARRAVELAANTVPIPGGGGCTKLHGKCRK